MKFYPPLCLSFILLLLCPAGLHAGASDDALAQGFQAPPDSAKPRTWWHWVSGNVSSEGITADLHAMKQIGIGGAQIFTVDQSAVKGPVVFLSPEWRKLVHQSMTEADQLNLEISMEGCDGWSESGGHWVTPEQSMQKVVWTESQVEGGAKIPLDLPQPQTALGYYQDIALYAFPTIAGDDCPAPVQLTASSPDFVPGKIVPSAASPVHLNYATANQPVWLQYQFDQPVTCGSLQLTISGVPDKPTGEMQASDDGITFHDVGVIHRLGTFGFPPATAKYFRVSFKEGSPKVGVITISLMKLAGCRVSDSLGRSGMRAQMNLPFEDTILAANATIDPKNLIDLTGKKDWDAPAGKWTLVRIGHTSTGATTHPSTTPGLECDKMSRAAVESHIDHLFSPVWADSPKQTGSTFRYILLDSWEAGCENWTPLLPDEFMKRRGYDLHPWLPALTGRVILNIDETERFLWDYRRTLADLVADNHYGVFQEQAHAHHMGLASEAPGIGKPTVADGLQCKGRCDIPMGEFWVNQTGDANVDDPKEAASAAHIYGLKIAATESYTSIPETAAWHNDPYSLKMEGDKEFCLGVNRFVFHRYAHQPWLDRAPGMSMGPWGINFERTNTWWNQGSAWITYLSRCEYLLQQGHFAADFCYFYGQEAPVFFQHNLLKPAVPAGYDYDACNAEILVNQMSFEDGFITLKSGMRYRVLVLPDTDRMTVPVLRKIEALVNAGAVVYGPKPVKSPSLTGYPQSDQTISELAEKVWGPCDGTTVTEHAYGKGKVIWGAPLQSALSAGPDFASASANLLYIHRHDGPAEIYFVSNQQDQAITTECTFRVAGLLPELWHPDSGRMESVPYYHTSQGRTVVPIHFDPSGSVFVLFRKPAPDGPPVAAVKLNGQDLYASNSDSTATLPILAGGRIILTADQPGTYEIITGSGKSVKQDCAALPPQLDVTGPWQLDFPPKLGAPATATLDQLGSWSDSANDGIKYFSGTATYRHDLELSADWLAKDRHVYLDLGSVKNLAEVTLNGKPLGILWKAPFRLDITEAAHVGTNHLELKITNLWPNRLIGDQKLPEDKRITWASVSLYKADSPLLPSGLLGPVTLSSAQDLKYPLP
jgi:hypothetical protein